MSYASARSPRVLYLPNEADLSDSLRQIGPRAAFTEMAEDGTIAELEIYSFLHDFRSIKNHRESQENLLKVMERFQPDIVFWQHPDDFPVDRMLLEEVRRRGGRPLLVYHEGDPFDTFYKRLKTSQTSLYLGSDLFFTTALGAQRRLFSEVGEHRGYYYAPTCIDRERFGAAPEDGAFGERRYDAVMIGSIAYRLRGLLKHPGSAERIEIARGLTKLFGERFAVFGGRWPEGTSHSGFLKYTDQLKTIRESRMSVIWENFPHNTYYFSDRLPISLAAGVPHITSRRPGLEIVLRDVPGLFLVDTVEDALDAAVYLKSLPLEEIIAMGLGARRWVLENLEARANFRKIFAICEREWRRMKAS